MRQQKSSTMAWEAQGRASLLPLEEFTRSTPPGWKPGQYKYTFKQYQQNLKLWWRSKNVDDNGVAAILVASRLQGLPRKRALNFRIVRNNVEYVGDDALVLPRVDDGQGNQLEASGFEQFLAALRAEYGLHQQDNITIALDKFFEHRRKSSLLTYLHDFEAKYSEAADVANLQVNDV